MRGPFAPNLRRQLSASYIGSLTAGDSRLIGNSYTFYLNALSGIDGSGMRVYGFVQLAAIYKRYLVRSCKLDVEFFDPSADGITAVVQVYQSTGGTAITGLEVDQVDQKRGTWTSEIANTGSQKTRVATVLPIAYLEGLSKIQFEGNPNYVGVDSTQPSLKPFIQIGAAAFTGTPSVDFRIRVTYDTEWSILEDLGDS